MKHSWQVRGDEPPYTIWRCLRCMGVLRSKADDPGLRTAAATFALGGVAVEVKRKQALPPCEGRGKVAARKVGRHFVKERVA